MRWTLFIALLASAAIAIPLVPSVQAGPAEDCSRESNPGNLDLKIKACSDFIRLNPKSRQLKGAYGNRGNAYTDKGEFDLALADWAEAIRLDPTHPNSYNGRGIVFRRKGAYDLAIADFTRAIELDPRYYSPINNRGNAYVNIGDFDRAIADYTKAIALDPRTPHAYSGRGKAYREKGDLDRAMADFNSAIRLDGKYSPPYFWRARTYILKGDSDRALADINTYIKLEPADPEPLQERAAIYEARGLTDLAKAGYRAALALPATAASGKKAHELASAGLARLEAASARPKAPTTVSAAPVAPIGRRVALVIANSNYASVERLVTPTSDARAIAASLRRLGFVEVVEHYDLNLAAMGEALKSFGDRAAEADWALVYYAGHGIEMNGIAYLVPTDAKLARDTHVVDEALPLERVLAKVEQARKLRLVILDSCRNNPFVPKMSRSVAGRSIGRGLARIEPEGGVLVAYSAKHGTIAADGAGAHSPFAEALLAHIEEPGLELQYLFRKVRDRVLEATQRAQEPFLYGSLSSEALFFKQ